MLTDKLLFVRADNADGENLDLLVVASDKSKAEGYWRTHYDLGSDEEPLWVGEVPGVTPSCPAGPIGWDSLKRD